MFSFKNPFASNTVTASSPDNLLKLSDVENELNAISKDINNRIDTIITEITNFNGTEIQGLKDQTTGSLNKLKVYVDSIKKVKGGKRNDMQKRHTKRSRKSSRRRTSRR